VAIHDDSRPIYDKHVGDFFGIYPPSLGPIGFRIERFVQNLETIRCIYTAWSQDHKFEELRLRVLAKVPDFKDSHPVRICDALVWTTGRKWKKGAEKKNGPLS
jgi:hypothetical protein